MMMMMVMMMMMMNKFTMSNLGEKYENHLPVLNIPNL